MLTNSAVPGEPGCNLAVQTHTFAPPTVPPRMQEVLYKICNEYIRRKTSYPDIPESACVFIELNLGQTVIS